MHADADFAGMFVVGNEQDPEYVKSRTGILLIFGDVPILWSSKLQSEIVLSTRESKYIALSQGMRDLVSVRRLVQELDTMMDFEMKGISRVYKAWQDNICTQKLVNSKGPLMTSRTKHISIKYH